MIKSKRIINNSSRGKTFGIVINTKFNEGESIKWQELTSDKIISKL